MGVPRGADDPQGPNRPGAGGFARSSPGRGSWGLSFSRIRAILTGRPGQDRPPPTAEPAQQHPPSRSPQTTAHPRPSRPTCRHRWQPTWQSVVARRMAGSGPVVVHHGSVAPVRRALAGSLLARRAHRNRPEALTFCSRGRPKNLGASGLPGATRRRRQLSRFGLVLPQQRSPVILALFPRRSPWLLLGKVGAWLRHRSDRLIR